MSMLLERFCNTLSAMEQEFQRHFPAKKDSWKTMPIAELQQLRRRITEKLTTATVTKEQHEEMIDLLVVNLMIAERLQEELHKEDLS